MSGLLYSGRMTDDDNQDDGWESYVPPDGADGCHIRWHRDDAGRWVPTGLYLHGSELTPDMLRAISLPRLAAMQNAEMEEMDYVAKARAAGMIVQPRPDLWIIETVRDRWARGSGLTLAELEQRAADVRAGQELTARHEAESAAHDAELRETWSQTRPAITRPDGSDPEAFYRNVAIAYRQYATGTKAPARAIADEAGVPVTTVHRWVREARQRGFLPQGRRGRVG